MRREKVKYEYSISRVADMYLVRVYLCAQGKREEFLSFSCESFAEALASVRDLLSYLQS